MMHIFGRKALFAFASLLLCVHGNVFNMEKSYTENNLKEDYLRRSKREVVNCTNIAPEVAQLGNHTDVHVFKNDTNGAISLVWTGAEGALLALTTMTLGRNSGPSKLYRSTNYGRSFIDISMSIKGDRILKDNGLRVNPIETSYVILVTDLSVDSFYHGFEQTTVIHVSTDSGANFDRVKCPFMMNPSSLTFSPTHSLKISALSLMDHSLWISQDFGRAWDKVDTSVLQARWDPFKGDLFYYSKDPTNKMLQGGFNNELYRVSMYGLQSTKIAEHIHSFGIQGEFIFISIEYLNRNGSRVMHVSTDEGRTWNAAQIPLINKEQFYSLLDMSEHMVFVHVDSLGDGGDGIIYTSDERGMIYSKSLEHHLYPNQGSITDFYKVESLPGVYITSQLLPNADNTVRTVITFDKGGTWEAAPAPENSICPPGESECKLQIHNVFSRSKGVQLGQFPKSSPSAPGIIFAHGNIGDSLNLRTPDVYVSSDGGYSWVQPPQLKEQHFYEIGDSGGILYAVSAFKTTNIVKFSLDEGRCWQEFKFLESPLLITGLSVEPGAHSTVLGLWGWDKEGDTLWRSITIDFSPVLKEPCKDSDYEPWVAHETNALLSNDKCLLGSQTVFKRRKKGTVCINGKNFKSDVTNNPCLCTKTDYLCDYGYMRDYSQDCIEDTSFQNSHQDICVEGTEDKIETSGYRKIPGDKCRGGFTPKTKLVSLHKSCIEIEEKKEDFGVDPEEFHVYTDPPEQNQRETKAGTSVGLVVVLMLVIMALVLVLVYLVKRRRQNHLRVKYSPLLSVSPEENTPSNHVNGNSATNQVKKEPTMPSYHDDSDEDLLVT